MKHYTFIYRIEIRSNYAESIIKHMYDERFKDMPFVYKLVEQITHGQAIFDLYFNVKDEGRILTEMSCGENWYVQGIVIPIGPIGVR